MFDFGIGASELLFIAIVALIVVGPKDLPRLLRTIGQYSRKIRGLAREFQTHLDEASKEAGLDDVKKEVKGMTNFTVTSDLDKQGRDIKRAIEDTAPKNTAPKSAAAPEKAPEPNSTTAVENAIAESEKPKPNKAAAPAAAKNNAEAPADGLKADAAGAGKPKPSKPKPSKPAKAKPASKPKQDAGRSHETVKS